MAQGGKAKSPKKTAAVRENARKPRGKWAGTAEREALEKAKTKGRMAAPDLIEMMLERAMDPDEETANRISAAKTVMDRCGLPVVSAADVKIEGGTLPQLVIDMGGKGLGWKKPVAPAPADRG